MIKGFKSTPSEIANLLDSDDELPDNYNEDVPDIPAYQNDNRFNSIKFPWIDKKLEEISEQSNLNKQILSCDDLLSIPQPKYTTTTKSEDKTMILLSRGSMSKRDIFFVKSIEEYSTDITLLWFIEFLKHKNVQPAKPSCLVPDLFSDQYADTQMELLSNFNMKYYFKLIVK